MYLREVSFVLPNYLKTYFSRSFLNLILCWFNGTLEADMMQREKRRPLILHIKIYHIPSLCWTPNTHRIYRKLCLTDVVTSAKFFTSAIPPVGQSCYCVCSADTLFSSIEQCVFWVNAITEFITVSLQRSGILSPKTEILK